MARPTPHPATRFAFDPDFTGRYPGEFYVAAGAATRLISAPQQSILHDTGWKETSAVIPEGTLPVRWSLSMFRGDSPVRAHSQRLDHGGQKDWKTKTLKAKKQRTPKRTETPELSIVRVLLAP